MGHLFEKESKGKSLSHSLYKVHFKRSKINEFIKFPEDKLSAYFYNLGIRKLFLSRNPEEEIVNLGLLVFLS